MRIEFVEIQNFRKLKACRIEIGNEQTIFVGANNSGKTSAIDALILFLKNSRPHYLATTDFTLSNWQSLNQIGDQWVASSDDEAPDIATNDWLALTPSVDIWLEADEQDLHRISHLLPTLDWTPAQLLGVRLTLAPKNLEQLYRDFRSDFQSARGTESTARKGESPPFLWPISMKDFLDRRLRSQFEVQGYILDPILIENPENGVAKPQQLPTETTPLDKDPFDGLMKIDVISAQRGFSDPKTEGDSNRGFASLSTQLRQYFSQHLNPSEAPDAQDMEALEAIDAATSIFNERLAISFKPAINELEGLNYPGFSDPTISITSKIDPRDSLNHDAAVQFDLPGPKSLLLPEKYNGLGYQNLISMIFNLIRFRDEWMRVGKAENSQTTRDIPIEPLHLVLIEEPEAHLHVQIQQVFIKKAYDVLRKHSALVDSPFCTQMIVSTHSPHIAHELDFSCLRYFRREPIKQSGNIPTATVINLSQTFGDMNATSKFATRYLRATHCDLFFADAAILVEGSAERMLIPHFVRSKFSKLDQNYVALLEIGGAHAHRLKPLLDTLGLISLIVTDLDSIQESSHTKVRPERDKGYRTRNSTLKEWIPRLDSLEELLNLPDSAKQTTDGLVRVAYQVPINLVYKDGESECEAIPYTFEDSLALTNIAMFRKFKNPKGLLRILQASFEKDNLVDACNDMFDNLAKGGKAEMALELLYLREPEELEPPNYISDGLNWLELALEARKIGTTSSITATENGV